MLVAWRACKTKYDPFDGSGAEEAGGRWNSAGSAVVYAADSFAGALLEILVHSARPRTLPGPHHAMRLEIPDQVTESLEAEQIPGWDRPGSPEARDFGDAWLAAARSAVLLVPALPARPIGRIALINLRHPETDRIVRSPTFRIPWDKRLF